MSLSCSHGDEVTKSTQEQWSPVDLRICAGLRESKAEAVTVNLMETMGLSDVPVVFFLSSDLIKENTL